MQLPEPRARARAKARYHHASSAPAASSGASAAPASAPTWQDYMNLIQSDPIYQKSLEDANAASVADASNLGSGILSALVGRGVVPDLTSVASKLGLSPDVVNWISQHVDLGQATALANEANKSGVSAESQIEQAHKTAMGNIVDALAARGLLRSGATPELTGNEERRDTAARYAADKALADYISGAYSAFTNNERGRQDSLTSALTDAYQRAVTNLGSGMPSGPTGGTPSPDAVPTPSGTPAPGVTPPTTAAKTSVVTPGGELRGNTRVIYHAPNIRRAISNLGGVGRAANF